MIRWCGILMAVVAVCLVLPGQAVPDKERGISKIMVEKLKNSQLLLEGMALADFAKIGRAADRLNELSRTAEWFVHKTPRYEVFTNEFRRSVEVVAKKAQERNIDGVALAYFDMTMSCIRCHQYVREVRDARAPRPETDVLVRR